MKSLSREAFEFARRYVEINGRELDLAWYRLVFDKGAKEDGYKVLKAYQWDNGGFGHALEADHRASLPSCYTTSIAFKWFESFGIPETDTMFKRALAFLKNNYNAKEQRWSAFPIDANKDPHAVWWHYNDGEEFCDAEKAWGLPSAEILGILLKYDPDNDLWQQCFEKAVNRLNEVYPDMEINETSSFLGMFNYLNEEKKNLIAEKMLGVLENNIETDESKWTEYCATPLMYIHTPESPFHYSFRELVDKNLDWEIERQAAEGCWSPSWQWYRDEEFWPEAKADWKSYLTVENLVVLKKFGRLT